MGDRGGHVSERLKGTRIWVLEAVGVSGLLTGGAAIAVGITGVAGVSVSGSLTTFFLCGLLFLESLDWDGSLLSVGASTDLGAVLVLVGVFVGFAGVGAFVS